MAEYQVPYQTEQDVKLSEITRSAVRWMARNGKYILLGLIVGAMAGFIDQRLTTPRYVGRMVGYSNNLNDIRIREFVTDLDNMRRGGMTKGLAECLHLSMDDAKTIAGFDASSHNALEADLPFPPRETQTYFFAIDIKGTDPKLFPKIQQGIVDYVNDAPYVRLRLEARKTELRETIARIDEELGYLQSVKHQQENALAKSGQVLVGDLGAISDHIITIQEKKVPLQTELTYMKNEIVVTKDVAMNPKPITPGPIRATLAGSAYGLALSLIVLAVAGLVKMGRE
jgi:hypothetical protein